MIELVPTVSQFAKERSRLLEELRESPAGLEWCRRQTELADRFLESIFRRVAGDHADSISLLAVGGYGRRELAPYSDVDILVIPLDDADPSLDQILRQLHRELHSAFAGEPRMSLSYAFFLVNDAPALDPKTRTAMLDARLVCGSEKAFHTFSDSFRSSFPVGEFLLEKIREREAAHAKWNDTPLAVEPNLKEGAGGVRSFQCANWIRAAIGAPPLETSPDYDEILKVRNLLHWVARNNLDRHTRPRQAEISEILNLPLAEHTGKTAGAACRLFENYLEAKALVSKASYSISEGLVADRGEIYVTDQISLSDAARGVALGAQLGLEARKDSVTLTDEIDGPAALYAISTGERTLRELDRCGLLQLLLPELTQCRTLMPEDAVHAFSVFEHTIRTVRNIESFPKDSFYGRLRDGLSSAAPLYLAALLHDVGKAVPGAHSVTGASMAAEVAERWKLAPGIAEMVEWLVREHLTLARFIGMRDVSDPNTANEFAELVKDRERLDALAVLTCADVSAVADNAWTPAQDAFLKELHGRTSALFELESPMPEDPSAYRRRLLRMLKDHPVADEEIARFLESLPAQYAISTPAELVPVHMELVRKAEAGEVSIYWDHDRDRNLSEVTVCAPDAAGLLSRILGVLYAFDLSVHGLRASTTAGGEERGRVALDTVLVTFGRQPAPPATTSLATRALLDVLRKKASLAQLLSAHGKDPERKQEHFTFNFIEGSPGILEIQAPRGRGMAFRIAKTIFAQGWNIVSARFGQWAGRGSAAFYVLGHDGRPLQKHDVEAALRTD